MGFLPPDVVTKWSTVKNDLNTAIGKLKASPPKVEQSTIDTIKSQMKGFDGGLTPKLKAAAEAKTPEAAAIALKEVILVIGDYKSKIRNWGAIGTGVGVTLLKVLNDTQTTCQSTLNALKPQEATPIKTTKGRF